MTFKKHFPRNSRLGMAWGRERVSRKGGSSKLFQLNLLCSYGFIRSDLQVKDQFKYKIFGVPSSKLKKTQLCLRRVSRHNISHVEHGSNPTHYPLIFTIYLRPVQDEKLLGRFMNALVDEVLDVNKIKNFLINKNQCSNNSQGCKNRAYNTVDQKNTVPPKLSYYCQQAIDTPCTVQDLQAPAFRIILFVPGWVEDVDPTFRFSRSTSLASAETRPTSGDYIIAAR